MKWWMILLLHGGVFWASDAAAQDSRWERIHYRPFGEPGRIEIQGDYLGVANWVGDPAKGVGQFQVRKLPGMEVVGEYPLRGCDWNGRFFFCGHAFSESAILGGQQSFSTVDLLGSGAQERIDGLVEAIDSAKKRNGLIGVGDSMINPLAARDLGGIVGSMVGYLVSDSGEIMIGLPYPGTILFFKARKNTTSQGESSLIWQYTGKFSLPGILQRGSPSEIFEKEFFLKYMINGVAYAEEISGYDCPAGWQSRDFGATWQRTILVEKVYPGQSGASIAVAGNTCDDSAGMQEKLFVSRNNGMTWSIVPNTEPWGDYLFFDNSLWQYNVNTISFSLRRYLESGGYWWTERSDEWDEYLSYVAVSRQQVIYGVKEDGTAFTNWKGDIPKQKELDLPFLQRKIRKVRTRGDEIYVLQGKNISESKLLRYRNGQWHLIAKNIQDFELTSSQTLVLGGYRLVGEASAGEDGHGEVSERLILRTTNFLEWDTSFVRLDSFYRVNQKQFIDRITLRRDGSLQAKLHSYDDNNGAMRVTSVYRSADQGSHWETSIDQGDTLPSIDTSLFRLDSLNNLYIRRSEEGVGLRRSESSRVVTLHGRTLRVQLAQSGPLQIDLVSPSGSHLPVARQHTLPAGEHVFSLPSARGVWYARVRLLNRTETVALPAL